MAGIEQAARTAGANEHRLVTHKLPAWADYGLIPAAQPAARLPRRRARRALHRREPARRRCGILVDGALGIGEGIGFTLYYATNFIFTGLAVAVAFHAGLFNIGGEGQAYSAASASRSSASPLDPGRTGALALPVRDPRRRGCSARPGRFIPG